MKLQGKTYKAVLILIALVCLLGTFLNQRNMNTFRRENQLTHTEQIDNMPPTLAFTTVVLGGFRGLIANVLWVRAMQMQEDGKFFEMAQLGDWITKLQISASTGTLEQIIEEEGISGVNHETGRKDRSTMVDNLAINMSKVILGVTDLVWGYSPVENLSSGKTITWNSLLIAFVGIILIMAGIISAFGAFMFHRKELALPNPTASMN